jgi:putative redox protein
MEMVIDFPGGKKVNATFGEHVVRTDQSARGGGEGSAPEPYVTFLASIGTCAGIYVLGFCQSRGISTDGVELRQRMHWDPVKGTLAKVDLEIVVPPEFPAKYHSALVRAANQCAVKKVLQSPPQFDVQTKVQAQAA